MRDHLYPRAKHPMTKRTTIRFTVTLEHIEVSTPSSAPFPAARRVIVTTGEAVGDSELPPRPVASVRHDNVIPIRKVG